MKTTSRRSGTTPRHGDDRSPIRRVTYLDSTGTPIAALAWDGSGTGPDHDRVGDLPTLDAFSSLRADETEVGGRS